MTVTYSPTVWRALGHPVRQRLVQLLSDGPRTTGELATHFPVSRFAVMKHLGVLERSGLVAVRREGRERWNILAAAAPDLVPRPGLAPHSGVAARAPSAGTRSTPQPALVPFHLEERVRLDAAPSRVFDALTFNVAAWWGAPYLRSPLATNVVIEPQLGGRFVEEWGHRQGFLRGVVTAIRLDERLEVSGRIAGDGPLPAVLSFTLEPGNRGTALTLAHRGVAVASPASPPLTELFSTAWAELVTRRLQAFVERGERAGIAESPPAADRLFGWF